MAPVHRRQEPRLATGPRVVSELQNLAAALPRSVMEGVPTEAQQQQQHEAASGANHQRAAINHYDGTLRLPASWK